MFIGVSVVEDQALKVQSALEKAELIAQICTQQKKDLASMRIAYVSA